MGIHLPFSLSLPSLKAGHPCAPLAAAHHHAPPACLPPTPPLSTLPLAPNNTAPPAHLPCPPACSKFVSGVLGSRTSPSMLLAGGLIATAALNVAFGFSTSLVWFCTWWAMNGMLQVRGAGGACVCWRGAGQQLTQTNLLQ